MRRVAELAETQVAQVAPAVRARGGELEAAGAVQLVRFAPQVVTAEVDDCAAHVEFTIVDDSLRCYCTCAAGRTGDFCAHCVATALATTRRVPVPK
ncbi:hypothetical protein [Streptosporangium sp. KLBMP 9127]|nr:hypothetical protein [Streptosporangium sp. KLBMP 9127]